MPHTLEKRVCLNADRTKVVDCDSDDAAFVLGGEGTEIPDEDAVKYYLVKPKKVETAPEEKAVVLAPANKAVLNVPQNKGKK